MGQRSAWRLAAGEAMTQEQALLHVGIAEFADPTLLLIGDATSLCWLADQIDARRDIKLAEMTGSVHMRKIDLHLVPAKCSGSLKRLGDAFIWEISTVEAQQFAQQLTELAAGTSPAHAYLDPESNAADVQVVASIGEYDPEKVFAA